MIFPTIKLFMAHGDASRRGKVKNKNFYDVVRRIFISSLSATPVMKSLMAQRTSVPASLWPSSPMSTVSFCLRRH